MSRYPSRDYKRESIYRTNFCHCIRALSRGEISPAKRIWYRGRRRMRNHRTSFAIAAGVSSVVHHSAYAGDFDSPPTPLRFVNLIVVLAWQLAWLAAAGAIALHVLAGPNEISDAVEALTRPDGTRGAIGSRQSPAVINPCAIQGTGRGWAHALLGQARDLFFYLSRMKRATEPAGAHDHDLEALAPSSTAHNHPEYASS